MAATQGEVVDSGGEAVAGLRREVTARVRMTMKKWSSLRRSAGTSIERKKQMRHREEEAPLLL